MFTHAICRKPGPDAGQGLADPVRLLDQHAAQAAALERLGLAVRMLDALPGHPDAYRIEDVAPLVMHFLAHFNRALKREVTEVLPSAMQVLEHHDWPGNVRQLRNVIERALILHPLIKELRAEHLPSEIRQAPKLDGVAMAGDGAGLTLQAAEVKMLREALERSAGNQSKAARLLGISRDTLRYRLKKYALG